MLWTSKRHWHWKVAGTFCSCDMASFWFPLSHVQATSLDRSGQYNQISSTKIMPPPQTICCLWSGFWRQQHFLLRKKPGALVLPLAKAMNFIEFLSIKLKGSVKLVVENALRDKICYGVVECCSFSCTSAAVRPRWNTGQIGEIGLGWKECTGNTQTHQHTRLRNILVILFIAMRTFLQTPTNVWRPCKMARLFGIASESVHCNLGLDAPRCASHPYLSKSSQFWNPESRSKGLNVIKAQHKVRISRVNQLHCFPLQQV